MPDGGLNTARIRCPLDTRELVKLAEQIRRAQQYSRMDLVALRLLHFGGPDPDDIPVELLVAREIADIRAMYSDNGRGRHDLLKLIFPAGEPRPREPRPGGIDFHRLHCLALDRLPDLIDLTLPYGQHVAGPGGSYCWLGSHPERPELVRVNMLIGCWDEPNTGRAGRDLVSFFGHMFGLSNGLAAKEIANWLGVRVRYAS